MQLYHLALFCVASHPPPPAPDGKQPEADSSLLFYAEDLSSFSFYQRSTISQFLKFFSKTVATRTGPGQRQTIHEKDQYTAHVYNQGGPSSDQLIAVVIASQDYPIRPAFSLLTQLLDKHKDWKDIPPSPPKEAFPPVTALLNKYQDPKEADPIMKVQQELDETKIILHKTIESVLERGEKLDSLVDRSQELSQQSKMFYKTAKKQNSCCTIM